MKKTIPLPDYSIFLAALKERILQARTSAARAVNRDLVQLYWDIGGAIVEKQRALGWGESVIDRLSSDLRAAFPQSSGFSPRSLRDMKRFYLIYTDDAIWRQAVAKMISSGLGSPIWPQAVAKLEGLDSEPEILRQLVAEIPWGHHRLLMNKIADPAACLYYLRATAQLGWSRNVLLNQIKAGAYERAVTEKKTHNFSLALPAHFAEQADEMMKSRYNLQWRVASDQWLVALFNHWPQTTDHWTPEK
jgi:predicted nuclease of restriction endonuclease-like (RecB) superfamily